MKAHIDTLRQMTIGQIKDMEDQMKSFTNKFWDTIDRQKEIIASSLQEEKCDEDWAEDFLKKMEVGL